MKNPEENNDVLHILRNAIIGIIAIVILGLCFIFWVPEINVDKLEGDVELYLLQPGISWKENQELQVSEQVQKYKISKEQTEIKRKLVEELKKIRFYRSVKTFTCNVDSTHEPLENNTEKLVVRFQSDNENTTVIITGNYVKFGNKYYKIFGGGGKYIKNILQKEETEENILEFVPANEKIEEMFAVDTRYYDQENISKIAEVMRKARKMDVEPEEFKADVIPKEIIVIADSAQEFISCYEFGKATYFVADYGVYALNNPKKNYFRKLIKALPTPNPEDELKEYPCGMEEEYVAVTKEELPEVLPLEEASVYQDLKLLPQEIQNMLYNNGAFFEVYNQKEYTMDTFDGSHYMNLEPFERPDWLEYIVFDFDHDDEKELAVVLKSPSIAATVEIFDLQEETVYAYSVVYRGFLSPQTDGSVIGSSGASQNIQYYFEFNKNHVKNKIIDQQDVSEYQICTEKVSEEEYYQYVSDRYQNSIPWSSDTLDAVLSK